MKNFATTLAFIIGSSICANAQTFLEHVEKNIPGQGTVTVTQSKAINELVNGDQKVISVKADNFEKAGGKKKSDEKQDDKSNVKKQKKEATPEPEHRSDVQKHKEQADNKDNPKIHKNDSSKREPVKHQDRKPVVTGSNDTEEEDIPVVDLRKKVMRKSYKTTGYRVQVFAGGNSRADRQKAEKAGDDVKMAMPDQPVYVHFYSPRWICRVGNYRSLNEANRVLRQVKGMGYRQACIVKGKISVQY